MSSKKFGESTPFPGEIISGQDLSNTEINQETNREVGHKESDLQKQTEEILHGLSAAYPDSNESNSGVKKFREEYSSLTTDPTPEKLEVLIDAAIGSTPDLEKDQLTILSKVKDAASSKFKWAGRLMILTLALFVVHVFQLSIVSREKGQGESNNSDGIEKLDEPPMDRGAMAFYGWYFDKAKKHSTELSEDIKNSVENFQKILSDYISSSDNKLVVPLHTWEFIFRQNLKKPESVGEFISMAAEPVTVAMSVKYDKDDWLIQQSVGDTPESFTVNIDNIRYEYARDYKNATPEEKAKMEEDIRTGTDVLLKQLLPTLTGVSLFPTEDIKKEAERFNQNGAVKSVDVFGTASGEANSGPKPTLDQNSPDNISLSQLRAEHAASVVKSLLAENGLSPEKITAKGQGELHLSSEERQQLLEVSSAVKIDSKLAEDPKLLELIERFNDGKITNIDALAELEQIVGSKRKISLDVEVGDKTATLVLPLPLLIGLIALMSVKISHDKYSGGAVLDAHFIPGSRSINSQEDLDKAFEYGKKRIGNKEKTQDRAKSYFGSDEPQPGVAIQEKNGDIEPVDNQMLAEEIQDLLPHKESNKRDIRARVGLEFNEDDSIEDRTGTLALILDRYARMTPTVTHQLDRRTRHEFTATARIRPTNISAEKTISFGGDYLSNTTDLLNIYNDWEAMQNLLPQIIQKEDSNPAPAEFDLSDKAVKFEFAALKPSSTSQERGRYGMNRRDYLFFNADPKKNFLSITIENIGRYKLDMIKLSEIADEHLSKMKLEVVPDATE